MIDPQSKESLRDQLDTTERGKVSQSIHNCMMVLQEDSLLQGAIRFNLLAGRVEIVKDLGWKRSEKNLTDTDMNYLYLYLERNYGLTSERKIDRAISIIANENQYHPIRERLNALQWDGTERIRYALHRFLGADASDYTYESLKLFMMGAIHRVFQPGCKFELMLCLVGEQRTGKSTFFRLLAIEDDWFSDNLRNLEDENVYRMLQGHWIMEMSEMIATANARSIEEIKSFLSRQKETYKVPYEVHPADRPRQCVFCGTSNALDFLPLDRSGNRRFVPVMTHLELAEVHILDDEEEARAYFLQMWAEAMEIYRSGQFKLIFSAGMEKQLKEIQKDFMPEDSIAGIIIAWLDDCKEDYVCSRMIFAEALNHPYDEPKSWQLREINDVMNHQVSDWMPGSQHRFSKYGQQRSWVRKQTGVNGAENMGDGFVKVLEQMELPFKNE